MTQHTDMGGLVEAVCEARNFVPNTLWHDGVSEGVARIERMIAEKQIAIVLEALSIPQGLGEKK